MLRSSQIGEARNHTISGAILCSRRPAALGSDYTHSKPINPKLPASRLSTAFNHAFIRAARSMFSASFLRHECADVAAIVIDL